MLPLPTSALDEPAPKLIEWEEDNVQTKRARYSLAHAADPPSSCEDNSEAAVRILARTTFNGATSAKRIRLIYHSSLEDED